MAGKTIEEAHTAQHNARRSRNNRGSNSQQMPSASTNMVTTTGVPPNGMITINGQTFTLTLTPTTTVSASVNTALTVTDAVFPGNLSDYNSNTSAFTLLVNIALSPASTISINNTSCDTDSESDTFSLYDQYEYKAYIAGFSHTSVNWRPNLTNLDPLVSNISPIAFTTSVKATAGLSEFLHRPAD
jgi:hypothetical protein